MIRNNCKPFNSFTTGNSSLNGIHSSINLSYFDRRVIAIKTRSTPDTPSAEHTILMSWFFFFISPTKLHLRWIGSNIKALCSSSYPSFSSTAWVSNNNFDLSWRKRGVEIFLEKIHVGNGLTTRKCSTCFSFYC